MLFGGGVLFFYEKAGLIRARLLAEGTTTAWAHSALNMIIAAIAGAND
ncbi:MAG: hypothetical protein WCE23_13995 [Candidatus Binatus sp.]